MSFGFRFLGNINDEYANEFISSVRKESNLSDFNVYINSTGGDVSAAITIYNFIKSLHVKVRTHNFSEVSSAAMIIYLAGTTRTCEDKSKFMIHPLSYTYNGFLPYYKLEELYSCLTTDITNYASIVNKETANLNGHISIEHYLKYESLIFNKDDAIKFGIASR